MEEALLPLKALVWEGHRWLEAVFYMVSLNSREAGKSGPPVRQG